LLDREERWDKELSLYDYAYVAWGEVLLDIKKDPAAAVENFRKAVELNPSHAHALALWGWALVAQGDHEGAIEKFRGAVKVNPAHAEALVLWGQALVAQGDHEGAIAKFRRPFA
jgi:tetratricopeptide (TPR) repeat protein